MFSGSSRRRPKNVLRTSQTNLPGSSLIRQISTSPGRHLIRPQDVRLGRPWDVRSRCTWGSQIGSFGNILGTLAGDVLGSSICPLRKYKFLRFLNTLVKFVNFLMSILNWQVNYPSNFSSFFIVMTHNSSVNFKLINFLLEIKGPYKRTNF